MNRVIFILLASILSFSFFYRVQAMPLGALVYRTSGNGLMYGYNTSELISFSGDIISDFYSGHVGIYVGEEGGKHYVVEALGDGVVKNEAKYFVNWAQEEEYLGAKLPKEATLIERLKAVEIAKRIAELGLGYDTSFRHQKGPKSGQWTCVGLTEKVYESAAISNPYNLSALEYDPAFYAVDITPDGFDNDSVVNSYGDTFAKEKEFSQIVRRTEMVVPAKEIVGYDAGYEHAGKRYFFLPYSQFLQPSLKEVDTDIEIGSEFKDKQARGSVSKILVMLKWSFINNPVSTVKNAVGYVARLFKGKEDGSSLALNREEGIAERTEDSLNYEDLPAFSLDDWENLAGQEETGEPIKTEGEAEEEWLQPELEEEIVEEEEEEQETEEKEEKGVEKIESEGAKATSLPGFSPASQATTAKTVAKADSYKVSVIKQTAKTSSSSYQVTLPSRQVKTTQSAASSSQSQTDEEEKTWPLLIRRLYATGNDDWIELYNPNTQAVDLKAGGYRLEKSKTAVDPSIMLRFDKEEDLEYRFGSIIPPGQSLVVANDEASTDILAKAHAIAKHTNFNWRGDGYSIYLASGPVSSRSDEDIVDLVGFGTALYYEGSRAPEILDNQVLWRKPRAGTALADLLTSGTDRNLMQAVDTDDNGQDFLLVPLIEQTEEEEEQEEEEEEQQQEEEEENDQTSGSAISVAGMKHLWHFDECFGEETEDYKGNNDLDISANRAIGYFGCGLETFYEYPAIPSLLSSNEKLDGNDFSISFWMNALANSSRTEILLDGDSNGKFMRFVFNPMYVNIEGLPNTEAVQNFFPEWDYSSWHLATISVDDSRHAWGIYLDGQKKFSGALPSGELLPVDFSRLQISNDNGFTVVDELALFSRGLSAEEIKDIYDLKLPFTPVAPVWQPLEVALLHFWDMNEAQGTLAADSVGGEDLLLNGQAEWILNSHDNSNLRQTGYNSRLLVDFSEPFAAGDLSLSFWWRNSAYPDEGRGEIAVVADDGGYMLAFVPSVYSASYFIDGDFHSLAAGTFPHDDDWHNIILSYDRLNLRLDIYVDGESFVSQRYIAWPSETKVGSLRVTNQNFFYDVDDMSVWRGYLTAADASRIYSQGRVDRVGEGS